MAAISRCILRWDNRSRSAWWIVPTGRTQAIFVSRGPIQRPLRLASLLVDTAGGQLTRSPALDSLDSAEADRLADKLLVQYRAARATLPRPA